MPRTLAMPAPGCCWICKPGIAASHKLFSAPPSGIHEPPCGPVIMVTSWPAAGTASTAIGLPLAYAVFRAESARVRSLARVLYQLPVALPPLVLAFGFILVFSSDTLPWLGSIWLLAAGHVVLALPYFLQTVIADMQRLGLRTLEDAAESLGSSGAQRFVHIVLPALSQSILAGLIIVAALSIGEFQFSNLVAGFLNRTYPVVLLQAFYGATGFACAATVILLTLAVVAAIAGSL